MHRITNERLRHVDRIRPSVESGRLTAGRPPARYARRGRRAFGRPCTKIELPASAMIVRAWRRASRRCVQATRWSCGCLTGSAETWRTWSGWSPVWRSGRSDCGCRRYRRQTNAFSKRLENHCHMLALWFTFYNFCRTRRGVGGKTPAQAAGLSNSVYPVSWLVCQPAPTHRLHAVAYSAGVGRSATMPLPNWGMSPL